DWVLMSRRTGYLGYLCAEEAGVWLRFRDRGAPFVAAVAHPWDQRLVPKIDREPNLELGHRSLIRPVIHVWMAATHQRSKQAPSPDTIRIFVLGTNQAPMMLVALKCQDCEIELRDAGLGGVDLWRTEECENFNSGRRNTLETS